MTLSPIVLFVYSRPEHTRRTLEALMQNDLADQSELFIYADGAKAGATEAQLEKIRQVREVIREKQWCRQVHIIEAQQNRGLAASVINGVTQTLDKYGRVIVLEDDLVTSPGFLKYMNEALDMYRDEPHVYAICGYTYPADYSGIETDTFFARIPSSWGWAAWKRSWQVFEPDPHKLLQQFTDKAMIDEFNVGGFDFYGILKGQTEGKVDSWGIRFHAAIFLKKGLFLYSKVSLVDNIGFDNTGTHTKAVDRFFYNPPGTYTKVERLKVEESLPAKKAIRQSLEKQFSVPPIPVRVINKLKKVLGLKKSSG